MHRTYHGATNFPADYKSSRAGRDPERGAVSYLSVKSPNRDYTGMASGKYDDRLATLAASMPKGSILAIEHEPEAPDKNLGPKQFRAIYRRCYPIVKEANPGVTVASVNMAWQHGPNGRTDAKGYFPDVGTVDALGLDWYHHVTRPVLAESGPRELAAWLSTASQRGLPMHVAEYGYEAHESRPEGLAADVEMLKAEGFSIVCYWDSTATYDWRLQDGPSQTAWRQLAGGETLARDRRVEVLRQHDIVKPAEVVRIADKTGLALPIACTLLEKESYGGRNVWGHDNVSTCGNYVKGALVTEGAYMAYKASRDSCGAQGVGPCQLTFWSFQDEADERGGCWKWAVNLTYGFELMAGYVKAHGVREAAKRYNGSYVYADDFVQKLAVWRQRLTEGS